MVSAAIPITAPLTGSIVAVLVLLLVHVPPLTALLNTDGTPIQSLVLPVIAGNAETTITVVVAVQPERSV